VIRVLIADDRSGAERDPARVAVAQPRRRRLNIDGSRDLGAIVSEFRTGLDGVNFPLGYRAELLGEYEERQAAQQRLFGFALITIAGIFLILMVSLGTVRLATLAFITMPMALVGGLFAAYWTDGVISLGSLVGFFTVLGIVARNGIMMISHFRHLEREEGMTFGRDLVIRGPASGSHRSR
jgi:Cu/Ag efflux pump CusA